MKPDTLHAIFYKGDLEDNYIGHQAEEILKFRLYGPYLEDKKDPIVVDVGANIGLFSLYASKYAKQVYALEPALRHFDTLSRMIDFNKLTNVKPINRALYYEHTKLPFYHNDVNQTMWSLYQNVDDGTQPPEIVETITLKELFDEEKIDRCTLLKLDCEGTEGEILGGKSFSEVADRIDNIILETHSWGLRNVPQIKDSLRERGFKLTQFDHDAQLWAATRE